jgi:transmembrane protein 8A/B
MTVTRATLKIINADVVFEDSLYTNTTGNGYKFFVPRSVETVTFRMTIMKSCEGCNDITFFVQPHSLPTSKNYLHNTLINSSQTTDTVIEFYPHENSWHYVDLRFFEQVVSDAPQKSSSQQNASFASSMLNNSAVQHVVYNLAMEYRYNNVNEQNGDENVKIESKDKDHSSDYTKYVPLMPKSRNFVEYPLLRQTYREFFMYDYDLVPDANGTVPVAINLTAGMPALMKFDIGDVYDIGGTLSFAIAMKYDITGELIESVPTHSPSIGINGEAAIAEKLVSEESKLRSNQTVIVCLRLNEPGIPTWPDKCIYGRHSFSANSVINNTDGETGTGVIHVPFPETGTWYVTIGLFCHGENAEGTHDRTARVTIIDSVKTFIRHNAQTLKSFQPPCSCAVDLNLNFYRDCLLNEKCLSQMNETETLKIKECLMDVKCTAVEHTKLSRAFDIHHKRATEQSVNGKTLGCGDGNCNTSVVFTLSSNPCVTGRCGRNGRCYHYMSGGFVFSTCLCLKFYRGWDCTEDSQVPSTVSIIAASLLLTLSNLLFIPSIYFSIRREYYTEAVIYFFAMFFSTFYHACDSGEEEFSFCLVKISVLQFCDFYCGLLAIWVTLIAMANIRPTFVSLLHMFGAILLAFGTELNKQSLWVFLAPALTGICIISVSWTMKCRKKKQLYPSKKYLALYLPLGSVLVMIGLVSGA